MTDIEYARFLKRVTVVPSNEKEPHWIWGGYSTHRLTRNGDIHYTPKFAIRRPGEDKAISEAALRLAYDHLVRPVRSGESVTSLCGMEKCVNPAHAICSSRRPRLTSLNQVVVNEPGNLVYNRRCNRGHRVEGANVRKVNGRTACKICEVIVTIRKKHPGVPIDTIQDCLPYWSPKARRDLLRMGA